MPGQGAHIQLTADPFTPFLCIPDPLLFWQWVGEGERQLRLLFEQAKRHQPSIIFFDEIDGLAPVRSVKQVWSWSLFLPGPLPWPLSNLI